MTDVLSHFEFKIISIVAGKPANTCYGMAVKEAIEVVTDNKVSVGAVYTVLSRLVDKGLLTTKWGKPTAVVGGKRKKYYSITKTGRQILCHSIKVYSQFS